MRKTIELISGLLWGPMDGFNEKKKKNNESTRYKAYAEEILQEEKADRCSSIISSIPPVDNPILKEAVNKVMDEKLAPLEQRI